MASRQNRIASLSIKRRGTLAFNVFLYTEHTNK